MGPPAALKREPCFRPANWLWQWFLRRSSCGRSRCRGAVCMCGAISLRATAQPCCASTSASTTSRWSARGRFAGTSNIGLSAASTATGIIPTRSKPTVDTRAGWSKSVGIAADIIDRANRMAADRINWVSVWIDIARLVLPTESVGHVFQLHDAWRRPCRSRTTAARASRATGVHWGPNSTPRVKSIYDNTGMMACDRLASGMESLVTPQSREVARAYGRRHPARQDHRRRKYLSGAAAEFPVHAALRPARWLHSQLTRRPCARASRSGPASCTSSRTTCVRDPGDTRRPRIRYQYCPLTENLLATNDYGNVDTNFRVRRFTVKQLVQKFGYKKVSTKVQQAWDNGSLRHIVPVIHARLPAHGNGVVEPRRHA